MTGTVTGVTGYQWYAGGQWRVMSPNCARTWSPIPLPTRGWGGPGPDCLTDFSVIAWINATSGERQFRF